MAEIVGGQSGSLVARGFDGTRGGGIRSIRPRRPEAGHGGTVHAVFVPEGHPSVPQQVEPGDGRRSPEERFEPVTVQGVHGRGEDGLLVENVFAAPLLEEADKLRGRETAFRVWWNRSACSNARGSVYVEAAGDFGQKNPLFVSGRGEAASCAGSVGWTARSGALQR